MIKAIGQAFIFLLNNSITAAWVILAVCLLRLLLRRCPRRIVSALWLLPALRLILPFSVESVMSLVPSASTVSTAIISAPTPSISSNIEPIDSLIKPVLRDAAISQGSAGVSPLQTASFNAGVIWLCVLGAMLAYMLISRLRLGRLLSDAVEDGDGIWLSDRISTPFVSGIVRPRIFLPYSLEGKQREYVLAHERMHIRRRDNITKPLAFLLLCVYWFNPAVWLAYFLFARDIELICDEAVISGYDTRQRKEYSLALLSCAERSFALLSPLAFGESAVKERIKMILNFKKPSLIVGIVGAAIVVIAALCLLTDPKQSERDTVWAAEQAKAEQESLEAAEIFDRELNAMFELGILAEKCETDKSDFTGMYNCRLAPHEVSFQAREPEKCYCANISLSNKGWVYGYVSEETGKLIYLSLNMYYQQGDERLDMEPLDMGQDKDKRYYYDCFYRLMAEDLTLGELCDKLCKYWGFSTYSIPERQSAYRGEELSRETKLKSVIGMGYIELYFDGDEPGEPMYLELVYFPGSVNMNLGWGHAVG